MTLSEISIRRPVFAWMLMFGLILFGWISFKRMGISSLPDVDTPLVSVALTYEGAAPEVMETDVVDVIEDAVMTVQGVRTVSSSARYASASIKIEFELDRNIDAALQEVQTKVAQAQRRLPKEMDPPIITKTNPEDNPILWLAVTSKKVALDPASVAPKRELMKYVRDQLKDNFSTVEGVGEVFLGGYVDPNLRVWVNGPALERYNLTVLDVMNTVSNEHAELPAGQIETPRKELDVRTMGEAKSVEEFSDLLINQRGGQPNYVPTRLRQVANVEAGLADVRRISRFNGDFAVGLGIRKQRGSNAVEVAQGVKKKMEEVRKSLPEGMDIRLNFDTTRFIEESVGELNFTLILSAILTALVCWAFLGSWSSTINVLMAIPTSIIGAFMILKAFGFTLNAFTLLGLSLAIGIVVDDAIMVLENIVRHREQGKQRMEAALVGSREITFAAIAASVSIIAIFLPVAFMRGVIGKFFFQFGITMTATVLLSLLEALTLTPMRCSQFLDAGERTTGFGRAVERAFHWSAAVYAKILGIALRHRWKVVVGSLAFFVASISIVKILNAEFVPAQDQSIFLMRIQFPVDSSIGYTDSQFKQVEAWLQARPEVERIYSAIGGFGGGEVNSGNLFVTMKEKDKRGGCTPEYSGKIKCKKHPTQQQFMQVTRAGLSKLLKDGKVTLQDLSLSGLSGSRGFPIEFTLRGPDWDKLAEISSAFTKKMEATGLMADIDTDYRLGKPEVRILPDRNKAARRGVSIRSIAETVNAMVGGVVAGKYADGGHRYDVRVRLSPDERETAEAIKHLFVRNNRGELIPLSELVKIEVKPSLQLISRADRERTVSVFANMAPGKSQQECMDTIVRLGRELPADYRVVMSGSARSMNESFQDLKLAFILGIAVAFMVLGSQFNSFIDPITVLMALPFSVSGAFVAFWLTGQSLNIYSGIGLILLAGIVKKNSILLVDFSNQVRERDAAKPMGQGLSLRARRVERAKHALLEACPVRLRPILMTSLATIAGAIPPALAIGPGAETRIPMAVGVIGGVFVSTLLTLLVVPCVYSLFAYVDWTRRD